jgi:hypothetical protein
MHTQNFMPLALLQQALQRLLLPLQTVDGWLFLPNPSKRFNWQ